MLPLFRRELQVASLSSGSRGNCTYVGDGSAGVLVDCGPSTRRIFKLMESVGLEEAPIDAVLITHEHSDHIGSARVLAKALSKRFGAAVPFFMTAGTQAHAKTTCLPESVETIEAGVSFRVKHIEVDPFTVPHDVSDPVAYRVRVGDKAAAVVTDLGRPTRLVAEMIRGVDLLVLEFNHDEEMLLSGPYPWQLKQRIRSNHGHLSNSQAAELLTQGLSDRLEHVVLAHLSDENNSPALAVAAARRALGDAEVRVEVAKQLCALAPMRTETTLYASPKEMPTARAASTI